MLLSALVIVYLAVTALPPFYSPPDAVRKGSDYAGKIDPPKSSLKPDPKTIPPPVFTIITNSGRITIKYPSSSVREIVTPPYTVHRLEGGQTIKLDDVSLRLKRIGHAWDPSPLARVRGSTHRNAPAQFYHPDLRPLSEAETQLAFSQSTDRLVELQNNRPSFRFDLEITGGTWRMLRTGLYDAQTQASINVFTVNRFTTEGYWFGTAPHLWHSTSVDLVFDLAVGMVQEMEIPFQRNMTFYVDNVRYDLIHAANDSGGGSRIYNKDMVEIPAPSPVPLSHPQSILLYHPSHAPSDKLFELIYLDGSGKRITHSGSGGVYSDIIETVEARLEEIRTVRIMKYGGLHRVVIRLPGLPGLPDEPVQNLFAVRAPYLQFHNNSEQLVYVLLITQLDMQWTSPCSAPSAAYPRFFTNATAADVLEDYARLCGAPGSFYVDQENLTIKQGQVPWLMEAKEKLERTWEKLTTP